MKGCRRMTAGVFDQAEKIYTPPVGTDLGRAVNIFLVKILSENWLRRLCENGAVENYLHQIYCRPSYHLLSGPPVPLHLRDSWRIAWRFLRQAFYFTI